MGRLNKNIAKARDTYKRFAKYLLFKRLLKNVCIGDNDECWEWQGNRDKDGYGILSHWNGKNARAHVVSYELFVGKIPKRHGKKRLFPCHSCDNPPCINPNHLWLGTNQQNMEDMIKKGRDRKALGENHSGEFNPNAKLNLDEAKEIKRLYAKKHYSYSELADMFSVSKGTIAHIIKERNWVN
jgi:hypothetical protein